MPKKAREFCFLGGGFPNLASTVFSCYLPFASDPYPHGLIQVGEGVRG
ncbi:hypothetical protein AYX15_07182 [Cryptococcus neoformans]|nr:hypothetical protein AYX15_07182 [Cryptococcus neoformans var. grubii]